MPDKIATTSTDIKRNICLKLDDYKDYLVLVRPFFETTDTEKYRILVFNKYPFIENFVYAEIKNEPPNKKYQERLILYKLLTSLRWESTFPASGYLVNSMTCDDKLKYTSPKASFINNKIVSFMRTE